MYRKHKDYFGLRNYKYQSVFHLAAENNALESLKILIDDHIYKEELLKKDFLGNTPYMLATTDEAKAFFEYTY